MKKILSLIFIIAVFAVISFALKNRILEPNVLPIKKMAVSASFYPLGFLAGQIGGNQVKVFIITPAGAEPHDYEPSPGDVAAIIESRILLLNGRGLEAWENDIRQNIDVKKTEIVITSDRLPLLNFSENGETRTDPHVWQDPLLVKQMANTIERSFAAADPENASAYSANLLALNAKLDILDQEFRQGLSNCTKKDIITSHSAFGYLAKEYGLNQISIAGLSPDAEPSPKQLAGIADFAKKNNISYIFFENLVSPRLANTIATEIGAKTLVLNPIEGLTPEELSAGKNYFTEMRTNLAHLKIALQCQNLITQKI